MKKILLAASVLFLCSSTLSAAPVDVYDWYFWRTVIGPNTVDFPSGDNLAIGGFATPVTSPDGSTTVTAQNGSTTVPLQYHGDPVSYNEYWANIPYNPSLTGSWTLTARNGTNSDQMVVPGIGNVGALSPAKNFAMTYSDSFTGVASFSWTVPAGASAANQVRFGLFDDVTNERIYFSAPFPITQTFLTIPAGLLSAGHDYTARVMLDDTAGDVLGGRNLSRSTSFFNFNMIPGTTTLELYLPVVDNGKMTFNCDVKAGNTIYIDPYVATGYDYAIGASDPKFASVILPFLGDNVYDLYLFDDATNSFIFKTKVNAGEEYFFAGGASLFRILGIEDYLGIDPANATAFITGLKFMTDGTFTGSMTPIVSQSVPEPATILLLGCGLMGLAAYRRKRLT